MTTLFQLSSIKEAVLSSLEHYKPITSTGKEEFMCLAIMEDHKFSYQQKMERLIIMFLRTEYKEAIVINALRRHSKLQVSKPGSIQTSDYWALANFWVWFVFDVTRKEQLAAKQKNK